MDEQNIHLDKYLIITEQQNRFMLHGLNDCIVGLNSDMRLVYSYQKMIEHFMKEMSYKKAVQWIDYNISSIESSESFQILYD